MTGQRKGYSLAEMIVVVMIIGALAFIALPRLNFAALHHTQAHTVARTIVTDLRRTRTMAISWAANNTAGFRMQMTGVAPYSGYQIVDVNSGTVADSLSIDSHINCSGDSQFRFGPLGNLLTGSGSQLTVSAEGRTYTITVIPGTGIVECTGG
jgi:prepilin-type N-terminal cleavage/methylation domain-containing protein